MKDPTITVTPSSAPPRHCHSCGNVLLDGRVTIRRYDIFTGLFIDEDYLSRRCNGPYHPPIVWLLQGDVWFRP